MPSKAANQRNQHYKKLSQSLVSVLTALPNKLNKLWFTASTLHCMLKRAGVSLNTIQIACNQADRDHLLTRRRFGKAHVPAFRLTEFDTDPATILATNSVVIEVDHFSTNHSFPSTVEYLQAADNQNPEVSFNSNISLTFSNEK
jgi:hypothetical protein